MFYEGRRDTACLVSQMFEGTQEQFGQSEAFWQRCRPGGREEGEKKKEREESTCCSAEAWRGRHTAWRSIPQHVKRKHRASLRPHGQKQTGLNAGRVYSFCINMDSRNPF